MKVKIQFNKSFTVDNSIFKKEKNISHGDFLDAVIAIDIRQEISKERVIDIGVHCMKRSNSQSVLFISALDVICFKND